MSSAPPSPRFEFQNYTSMTIESCSEANKLGNGRYVKSDRFNAGGHSWRIVFYPNGRLAGTTASMSLFLLLDDDATAAAAAAAGDDFVHVKFRLMIHEFHDHDGKYPVFTSSTVTAAFSRLRRSNAHGFERFVSRDDFEKTALFRTDRFSIRCRLTVFPKGSKRAAVHTSTSRSVGPDPSVMQAPPPPPPASPPPPTPTPSVVMAREPPPEAAAAASPKPSVVTAAPPPASPAPSVATSSASPPSVRPGLLVPGASGPPAAVPAGQRARAPLSGLPADLGRLLETKDWSDVVLEVRGKVFAAHKSVLAARAPVFMEELFGPEKEEDTSYVRIVPDMRPEAFQALLHYLYTDTLPAKMAMNSPEEGVVLAEDLLAAADRYDLKDLKVVTENKMCSHIGVSTVLPMLVLAERHQCCKLKKMCLEFIGSCRNARAVMATIDHEVLARSSPSLIKDVITEILDASETRRLNLIDVCIFAFCFILPFFLFAIFS